MTPTFTDATVLDVLAPDSDRKEVDQRLTKALTATAVLALVSAEMAGAQTGFSMATLIEGIRGQFYELLKEPLSDISVRAWERSREVRDAMEETKKSGDVIFVPLLDHSFSSTQRPKIEIMIGPKKVHTLEFAVELEIQVEGMRVEIRSGKIAGMKAAQVQAQGSVKLEGYTLAEKSLEPVRIF